MRGCLPPFFSLILSPMIAIIPIGDIPFLEDVRENVEETFCMEARIERLFLDLSQAYNPYREQVHAGTVLRMMDALSLPHAMKSILITDLDLYEEGLNFVFGEARLNGRDAVVSTYRLRHPDPDIFRERLLKEVNHELGHTFGLGHCPEPSCVMSFSNSISDVDRKSRHFCPDCRRALNEELILLGIEPCQR